MGTIRVRVADESAASPGSAPDTVSAGQREVREIFGRGSSAVIPFETAELAASLRGLTSQLGELFGDLRAVGGYELQEVQVGLEISAEGGFNLIGSAKAGGKGAITLTFAPGRAADGQDQG
jgi:hypothetical protein